MAKAASAGVDLAVEEPRPDTATPGDEARVQRSKFVAMRDHLARQPKVRVMLSEDTLVQLNGFTINIKGGEAVMVPEQVFDVLVESKRV
jgi:hypothetical protein